MNQRSQWQKLEKKFLAYLFKDKRYIALAFSRIKKEHLPLTNYIYALLTGYYNRFHGIITDEIVDTMFKKKNIDEDTIVKYKTLINEIKNIHVNDESEFEAIINELKDFRKRENFVDIAKNIIELNPIECSNDKLEEMQEEVKKQMLNITSADSTVKEQGLLSESIKQRKEEYYKKKNNPELLQFIKSGFRTIDEKEGGFRPSELVYVIGRKGDGKSVLMLNFAFSAWLQGKNVILYSLEMSKADYERRFDSRASGVSTNGLKMGKLTEVEERVYDKYLADLENGICNGKKVGKLYIVDCPGGCTPAFIEAETENAEQLLDIKFDMIISDYAGIMRPNVKVNEKRHEQGQIALDLKRIARNKNCVVISAAQMTRKGKEESSAKDGGQISTEHVAESDQIADHIDWGISIRTMAEDTGKVESFKTRDAEPFSFKFNKKYSCMKVEEVYNDDSEWNVVTEKAK